MPLQAFSTIGQLFINIGFWAFMEIFCCLRSTGGNSDEPTAKFVNVRNSVCNHVLQNVLNGYCTYDVTSTLE